MALEFSQMENLIKQLSILDLVFRNFIISGGVLNHKRFYEYITSKRNCTRVFEKLEI